MQERQLYFLSPFLRNRVCFTTAKRLWVPNKTAQAVEKSSTFRNKFSIVGGEGAL